jgi:U6 snRNA-associated Sm-like protein LSm2
LHSVDQYLNIKLQDVTVVQPEKYPQLTALQNCFIRGSVVRYIQIPPEFVDTELLQDAARKENTPQQQQKGKPTTKGQTSGVSTTGTGGSSSSGAEAKAVTSS